MCVCLCLEREVVSLLWQPEHLLYLGCFAVFHQGPAVTTYVGQVGKLFGRRGKSELKSVLSVCLCVLCPSLFVHSGKDRNKCLCGFMCVCACVCVWDSSIILSVKFLQQVFFFFFLIVRVCVLVCVCVSSGLHPAGWIISEFLSCFVLF